MKIKKNFFTIFIFLLTIQGCKTETVYNKIKCGNGITEYGEECDDGNNESGDGCSALCIKEPFEICNNGVDDDGNGFIDCTDPLCQSSEFCIGEICGNGFDDDGNNLTDCDDPACISDVSCLSAENCTNGFDDDGNGAVDCNDNACTSHPFCGACPSDNIINSQITVDSSFVFTVTSNQTNSYYSCLDPAKPVWILRFTLTEPLSANISVSSEIFSAGLFKEEEPDVTCFTDTLQCILNSEISTKLNFPLLTPGTYRLVVADAEDNNVEINFGSPSFEICDNGFDDDQNGLVDCEDSACSDVPYCKTEICDNGFDDDQNGLIDCEDSACAVFCAPPEICDNGADDDLDGTSDCGDFDCIGTDSCMNSVCISNAYAGSLTRGSFVTVPFDTLHSTNSIISSCGGIGSDFIIKFNLETRANILLYINQNGSHSVSLATLAGNNAICTDGELFCKKSSGLDMPQMLVFNDLPPAEYYIFLDTETSDASGDGTVEIQVAGANEELCSGGEDDDNDGLTDCNDDSCEDFPLCSGETLCHDNIDNDGDGFADCADPDCMSTAPCVGSSCSPDRFLGELKPGIPLVADIFLENGTENYNIPCSFAEKSTVLSFTTTQAGKIKLRLLPLNFADPAVALSAEAGQGSSCDSAVYLCTNVPSPGISTISETNNILPPGNYFLIVKPFYQGETGITQVIIYLE